MVVTKKTKAAGKKKCNICAVEKTLEQGYYKISQTDPNFPDGRVNVCRTCLKDQWEDEFQGFNNFIDFLRIANLPYNSQLYNQSKDKSSYLVSVRTPSYRDRRFMDSDSLVEEKGEIEIKDHKLKELTKEQMEECALFWGKGYNEQEYLYLMNEYADFDYEYDLSGKSIKVLVAQLCLTNLRIRDGLEQGKDVSKELKNYQDLLHSASLKPAQEKAAAENEAHTFGTFIKKIENDMPIAAPLPEFQDVDGIIKYIKVFFTGAMAESMGEDNPYPEEYKNVMSEFTVDYVDDASSGDEQDG